MACSERNGNKITAYTRFLEMNRDALPAESQQAASSQPSEMLQWMASTRSNQPNLEFFNPAAAAAAAAIPEVFARYQRDQKLQFIACQREQQQHGFFAMQNNAQSIAPAFGAFGCPQLPVKFAEEEEVPLRNFPDTSLPVISQEQYISPAAAAAAVGTLSQLSEYTTTNSKNTGKSDQVNGLETVDLENDIILKQLEEAIQMIPPERKQAYLESLKACDENIPSFLFQFLRRCDYNVWDTAERLVRYWQLRKETFAERAFLPMILTGDGALTREDVMQLKAGFPSILPDTKAGVKVLWFDRSQCLPNVASVTKLRCIFYVAHVMSQQDKRTQTDGLLALIVVSQPRWRELDSDMSGYVGAAFWMAENVLPVRITYHLLNFPPAPNRRFCLQDYLYFVICNVIRHGNTRENLFVHFERQKGELLDALLDLGLTREGIPIVVGGTFSYAECVKWFQHQVSLELQKYFNSATLTSDVLPSSDNNMSDTASGGVAKTETRADQEERRQRTRELNLIHSRRKRERKRAEIQNVVEERDELLGEQEALLVEHARLTNLLDQANRLIRTAAPLQDDS